MIKTPVLPGVFLILVYAIKVEYVKSIFQKCYIFEATMKQNNRGEPCYFVISMKQ